MTCALCFARLPCCAIGGVRKAQAGSEWPDSNAIILDDKFATSARTGTEELSTYVLSSSDWILFYSSDAIHVTIDSLSNEDVYGGATASACAGSSPNVGSGEGGNRGGVGARNKLLSLCCSLAIRANAFDVERCASELRGESQSNGHWLGMVRENALDQFVIIVPALIRLAGQTPRSSRIGISACDS